MEGKVCNVSGNKTLAVNRSITKDEAIADLKVRSEISQKMKGVMDFYSRFMFL